ncbi:Asp23/Gls24 family envelope stress response protein [Candidatus Dependentiae bacterium]|nr:Asp23/Gls24 family envelope stress response protein [Candidatus Dependentiae bacterium]
MEQDNDNRPIGDVNISNDVVSNIAGMATIEIDGVISLSGSVKDGLVEFLGNKKEMNKGIEVDINEGKVKIDVSVIIEFGMKIPDISWRIQQNVKRRVEEMTGLSVTAVNVLVRGVEVRKENLENSANETIQ